MTGPPPKSTLFPYTTLFRSRLDGSWRSPHRQRSDRAAHVRVQPRRTGGLRGGRDRKSTRLNSSHVKISYAVFCLKKKKHAHRVAERSVLSSPIVSAAFRTF